MLNYLYIFPSFNCDDFRFFKSEAYLYFDLLIILFYKIVEFLLIDFNLIFFQFFLNFRKFISSLI